jgi:hypothetical protein
VGLVAEAALAWGWLDAGSIFAALQLPQIVEVSVKRASQKDGYHDRKIQFMHSGFIADAHGGGPTFNASAHAESESQATTGAKVADLPAFETDAIEMAKWVRDVEGNESATGSD